MKIHVKGNYVDLSAPIFVEEDQLDKIVNFLKDLTGEEIEIQETLEKDRFANVGERHPRKWTGEELILLLDTQISESELVAKLKRSEMSVLMQRAQFVPEFVSWAKSKGYDASKISKTIIEKYLEEKDENSKRK